MNMDHPAAVRMDHPAEVLVAFPAEGHPNGVMEAAVH
jgi:hypothetical protein